MSKEMKNEVFNYINGRVITSAKELSDGLGITVQRAGKYIKALLNEGTIEIDHTHDAVNFYKSTSVRQSNRNTVDVTEAHSKDTQEVVDKIGDAVTKNLISGAETSGYNRGFAQGYALGRKESAREAYEDGKQAVLRKLTELLS